MNQKEIQLPDFNKPDYLIYYCDLLGELKKVSMLTLNSKVDLQLVNNPHIKCYVNLTPSTINLKK